MTLQEMISESRRIVFFGGAGVSTESGIPDFRSTDGLYKQKYQYPPETILSHSFFTQYPEEFFQFYRGKMLFPEAKPNQAHEKLAELEKAGKLSAVITQNIDGLHSNAGSKNVYELHGSVHRNYCCKCGKFHSMSFILHSRGIPRCNCGGIVKPDVVLYEESLNGDTMEAAIREISLSDMLIVAGTSLVVYPAAGFVDFFRGKYLVIINKSATVKDQRADLCIRKPVGEILSEIVV